MTAVESACFDVSFLNLHVEYILISVVFATSVGCSARNIGIQNRQLGGHGMISSHEERTVLYTLSEGDI
jgi:hypothetical protein